MTWSGVLGFLGLLLLCDLPADATLQREAVPLLCKKSLKSKPKKAQNKMGKNSIHALSGLTPLPWIHFGFLLVVMVTPGIRSHDELSTLDDSGQGESCME